jgi:hypothetical protein
MLAPLPSPLSISGRQQCRTCTSTFLRTCSATARRTTNVKVGRCPHVGNGLACSASRGCGRGFGCRDGAPAGDRPAVHLEDAGELGVGDRQREELPEPFVIKPTAEAPQAAALTEIVADGRLGNAMLRSELLLRQRLEIALARLPPLPAGSGST